MLDMGEPVLILDLAERMIRLSGRQPGTDVQIEISGVRPGEKLAEELVALEESKLPTGHPSVLRVAPVSIEREQLEHHVLKLERYAADFDANQCRASLQLLAGNVGAGPNCDPIGVTESVLDTPISHIQVDSQAIDRLGRENLRYGHRSVMP